MEQVDIDSDEEFPPDFIKPYLRSSKTEFDYKPKFTEECSKKIYLGSIEMHVLSLNCIQQSLDVFDTI
jgi:hypothetical protein